MLGPLAVRDTDYIQLYSFCLWICFYPSFQSFPSFFFLLCVWSAFDRVGPSSSERFQSASTNQTTFIPIVSTLLLQQKGEGEMPQTTQAREGKQYYKHLENEDMENSPEQFPEMSQEILALFNASYFCQPIFISALNVSISVYTANWVIFNSWL